MNIRLWIIELLIKPSDLILWNHDNKHGTLGMVNKDAEYDAILVMDGETVGLKKSIRRWKETSGGITLREQL